jgi:hypothetical protein
LDEVPEQCGHANKGGCRDGQELPHAEAKVPARKVCVDERSEEVVVVVPRAAEDVRPVDHAGVDKVVEEEWARRPAARWSRVGTRCGEASNFCRWRFCSWDRDGRESVEGSKPIACWVRSLRRPENGRHTSPDGRRN